MLRATGPMIGPTPLARAVSDANFSWWREGVGRLKEIFELPTPKATKFAASLVQGSE